GIAVLAHPSRKNAWQCFESQWEDKLMGIEIWNRKYDGWAPSETASPLLQASGAVPFVGLDFHTQRQSFSMAMAVEVSGEVSEQAILTGMRSRQCHARVFGAPLSPGLVRTALPALTLAERSRRTVAAYAKKSGLLSVKR